MGLQKKIRVDTSIKKKNAKLNIKYAILQMMFWTCAASAYAYLTQMLQYKGFTDGQIGVINAVKLFSTVVFQIIIGVFSDRHAERIQLKYIISVLTAVALLLTSVFYEYKLSFVQTVMLFIGFGATFTTAFNTNYNGLFSAMVVIILPPVILYCVFSKFFIEALSGGAVKG
mgnify:CR=1 FL=1